MPGQVFMNFTVPKLEIFSKKVTFFLSFIEYYTFFVKNYQKIDAQVKFTSQNLMSRQKLTPEIPNAQDPSQSTEVYLKFWKICPLSNGCFDEGGC